jgi:hypothetical protein
MALFLVFLVIPFMRFMVKKDLGHACLTPLFEDILPERSAPYEWDPGLGEQRITILGDNNERTYGLRALPELLYP